VATPASPPAPIPIDDALALVAGHVTPLPVQHFPLEQAYGRFLSQQLTAGLALPPFDSSSMDGFALRAGDTPGSLRIVGESAAGTPFEGELGPGDAVAISTGAVVPHQADAVVPIEDATVSGVRLEVPAGITAAANVRFAGSDIAQGAPLLAPGTRVGPAQLGAAAAVGFAELPCRRSPTVAIVTTGDELRQPGAPLGPGEIYDSNRPLLRAALRTAGAEIELIPVAADTPEAHRQAFARALEHDVVISTGGVSVGRHDLVRSVGAELGVQQVFWRVALRPGKPLAFGVRGTTLVFGLPGNPVSTLVCFELFVRPALLALQGARDAHPRFERGALGEHVTRNPQRDDLIRVAVELDDGRPVLYPLAGQESHQIAVTAQADALARIPTGAGQLLAGTAVDFLRLHSFG
jgi:molybdopterin molybdotransferase